MNATKLKKILIILTIITANIFFAQTISKLKLQNNSVVLDFENQTALWKNKTRTNMILLLEDGFKNGYKWQEYEQDKNGNNNHIGTFVFLDKKGTKGYYIKQGSKTKIPFTKQ